MKKSIMKEWVMRLRSGELKQAKRVLDDGVGYCCLGVLCTIALERGIVDYDPEERGYDRYEVTLPESVVEWAGMLTDSGRVSDIGLSLISMNDGGESFKKIADVIEKHWRAL